MSYQHNHSSVLASKALISGEHADLPIRAKLGGSVPLEMTLVGHFEDIQLMVLRGHVIISKPYSYEDPSPSFTS